MSKFSGICLEEDGRNKVFVFKAGIKMLLKENIWSTLILSITKVLLYPKAI